jgi:putative nucleotidyltransferase with HDIG domain
MTAMVTSLGPSKQWRTLRFEVLEKLESLPSLNNVVIEFLELSKRDFSTAKDFEAVISKDQALVARLLKVANSGLYGRPRTIRSIPEAVVLVGLERLKKMVYAVSTEGLTRRDLNNYAYHPGSGFWMHSLGVAHMSRILADAAESCPLGGEEAFVAGLVHDIGKLVIDDFLDPEPGQVITREDEVAAVGLDHTELAEHVLRQWNLPESITACVRHHHDYRQAGSWAPGAAVLTLAECIGAVWGLGQRDPVDLSVDVPVERFGVLLEELAIRQDGWDQIIVDIRESLAGLEGMFDPKPVVR